MKQKGKEEKQKKSKKWLIVIPIIIFIIDIIIGVWLFQNWNSSSQESEVEEVAEDTGTEVIVDNTTNTEDTGTVSSVGKIVLTSKDQEGNPVSNNKYTLTRVDGTYIGEVESGITGIITFYYVPEGDYIMELTSESNRYYSEVTTKNVTVDAGITTYVNFTSEKIYGNLNITVIDDLNRRIENAEFGIYDNEGYLLYSMVSDEDGKIRTPKLTAGTYYFKTKDSDFDGYTADDTLYEFEVTNENRTFYATITYEAWKGTLLLVVTDENGEVASDISYTIYDENKEEISQLTTNAKGLAGLKNIPVGTYYYKQDNSEDDYHEFTIEEDEQISRQDITALN